MFCSDSLLILQTYPFLYADGVNHILALTLKVYYSSLYEIHEFTGITMTVQNTTMPRWSIILVAAITVSFTAIAEDSVVIAGDDGKAFHQFMSTLTKQGFSGSILVEKNGKVILANGYGLANVEQDIPNTPEMVYTFGSITKQFTAAAILKLEMQGKLKTTDKISKFFDRVPKDKRTITVHHLLTHTAGLRDAFGDDFSPVSREKIIERAMRTKLRTDVGETHFYSNAGYSLLGAIVEIVSGQSYEHYLRENLFLPAGMQDTGYKLPNWSSDRIAHGYSRDGDWGTLLDKNWDTDGPWWNLRANGGIMSTVLDMYTWHRVLLGDTILSAEAKEKMFTRHVLEEEGGSWYYGYGWALTDTERGTRLITHNGGNGIFFADIRRYIDDGVTIIYTCNHVDKLTGKMEQLIRKQALNPPAIPN